MSTNLTPTRFGTIERTPDGGLIRYDRQLGFPVEAVVYGHMHRRATDVIDGVRFEEVSLGYPRDWSQEEGIATYLRRILPAPPAAWEEPPSWVPPSPPDWLLEKAGAP